ncbi:MAG: hypothetical protein IT204_14175 [Fimbriimonadaceae bacterium]|nr:hypothetical protein [Fimbriimonadaceae bacterium]
MRWRRWGAALVVWWLSGCSGGSLPVEPLLGSLDEEAAFGRFELLSFDDGHLSGSPFSRTGASPTQQAIDAMTTAVRATNSLGLELSSFNEGSRGLALADSFVYVPVRSGASTELIDQQDGELRVRGTLQQDPAGNISRVLRITGPQTDLLLQNAFRQPDQLTSQLSGRDLDARGRAVTLKHLERGQLDRATGRLRGRLRVEVFRDDGTLLYAGDTAYERRLGSAGGTLDGRDLWRDPDGYWVASRFDLDLDAAGRGLGWLEFTVSDDLTMRLELAPETVGGSIVNAAGEAAGSMAMTSANQVVLLNPGGSPMLTAGGEPVTFTIQMAPARPPAPATGQSG